MVYYRPGVRDFGAEIHKSPLRITQVVDLLDL